VYFHRCNSYYEEREFSKAILDFEFSLKFDPNNDKTLLRLGAAKRQNGNMKGAYIDYSKAIRINPNNSDLWFNRGHIKKNALDVNGATEDFKRAVELGDSSAQKFVDICSKFTNEKPYEEFIDEMPLNYDELISLGLKYNREKNNQMALGFFMKAKELYPLLKGSDHFINMVESELDDFSLIELNESFLIFFK
jgi:tetratricopeptide (TPR) repeat protein